MPIPILTFINMSMETMSLTPQEMQPNVWYGSVMNRASKFVPGNAKRQAKKQEKETATDKETLENAIRQALDYNNNLKNAQIVKKQVEDKIFERENVSNLDDAQIMELVQKILKTSMESIKEQRRKFQENQKTDAIVYVSMAVYALEQALVLCNLDDLSTNPNNAHIRQLMGVLFDSFDDDSDRILLPMVVKLIREQIKERFYNSDRQSEKDLQETAKVLAFAMEVKMSSIDETTGDILNSTLVQLNGQQTVARSMNSNSPSAPLAEAFPVRTDLARAENSEK